MACAVNPMGDLYKTQVRELAAYLEVPARIREKAPSAGLWAGQTDEGDIGLSYDKIDGILFELVDRRKPPAEVVKSGFPAKSVKKIASLIERSEFKRKMPPIAKLSTRTVGLDFLYSYDRGR